MALTTEQIEELKTQLKSQVQNLDPSKKAEAENQIDSMSPQALETMLQQQQSQQSEQKIFRMIVEKQIPSVQVGENPQTIAVLSVKAISEGHTIIIPKTAAGTPDKIPKEAFSLTEEISEKISSNLGSKENRVETETSFGESIINIIPIYNKPLSLASPRIDKTPEELEKTKAKINTIKIKKETEIIKIKKKPGPKPKPLKLKRHIP